MTTRPDARTPADPDRGVAGRAIALPVPADIRPAAGRRTDVDRAGPDAPVAALVTRVRGMTAHGMTARDTNESSTQAGPAIPGATDRPDRRNGPAPAIDLDHRMTGHRSIADLAIGRPPGVGRGRTGGIGRLAVRGRRAMTVDLCHDPARTDVHQVRTVARRAPATHHAAALPVARPVPTGARLAPTAARKAPTAAHKGRTRARRSDPPTRRLRSHRRMSSARTRS